MKNQLQESMLLRSPPSIWVAAVALPGMKPSGSLKGLSMSNTLRNEMVLIL